MAIGILIVCFTAPKTQKSCQSSFTAVLSANSVQRNSRPRSVAAGDFNHDHLLDIVVANSGTNTIGIFLNYGNDTFATQMILTTGDNSKPLAVAVGDFNNDTHLDIVVVNYDSHNIGMFLGYGNGTFANQTGFSTGVSRPRSMGVGDMNNDQYLDIVITNDGTNDIGIYFGYGNGSLGNLITYSTGYDSLPYSVVIGDWNKDHQLDIAVANYGTDNMGVFLGYGNGSFTPQTIYSTSLQSGPSSIAVNDFNNDTQQDIAVANYETNNVGIFLGYGNGSFAPQMTSSISPGYDPHSIIIGDFNQDYRLDIAVSNYGTDNIGILIGYGNGSFKTPTMHETGSNSYPFGMVVGDFDNDNQSDIAVVNSGTNNILLLIGYFLMQSKEPTAYSTGNASLSYGIASGDLNNDTHLDLVVSNSGTNNVGVFLGHGNGSFEEQRTYSTGNDSYPRDVIVSDLDKNHRLDIVVANSNSQSVGILYGYGDGTFATLIRYFTGDSSYPIAITAADFNNDHCLDIAFVDYNTNSIGIFLGYGNRTFGNLTTYWFAALSRPHSIAAGDFNNDGQLDIVVANYGANNIVIFLKSNNGTFTLLTNCSTGDHSLPWMLTTADLNKDNHLDIIVANSKADNIGVFFGFGNGSFNTQLIYSTGLHSNTYWISVADLNNDSWLDLTVANSNAQNVGILLGNRQGYFGNQTTYSTGTNSQPRAIVVGDFNKDDRLDLAVANYGTNEVAILLGHPNKDSANQTINATDTDPQLSLTTVNNFTVNNQSNSNVVSWTTNDVPILLGNYYATFRSQTRYEGGSDSHPSSMAIGDLNNDKQMDIVVANSNNQNLGVFLGYGNGTFASEMIYSLAISSNPQNVILDDFNKDNLLDVAVTNPNNDNIIVLLGNGNGMFTTEITYSTGDGSHPTALATGNFVNDKYLDLVVANVGTDTIGIFFGYDYTLFSRQKPCESGEGSGPNSVAIADLNNDGHLDIVSTLWSSDRGGVFLGYGNGTFTMLMTFANLPSSRPYSVVVGDFNNDKQLDITLANYGTDDISVVLGYGNGTFRNPISYSTGYGTRPTSVAVGDFNNDQYLDIATANSGGNSITIFRGYGNGTFQKIKTFSTGKGSAASSITVSDINNDAQLDIIVTNKGTKNVGIFLGYGNGSFSEQMNFSTGAGSTPLSAAIGDFNKDGRLDLVIANYGTSNVVVLYGYGNGTFANLTTYKTGIGSNPTDVKVGDFNNDNQSDIIVSDETSQNVGIFFGYSDGTFATISIVPIGVASSSYGVAVGDLNNDHRLDFIIADTGNDNIGVFLANGSKPFGGQTTFPLSKNSRPVSVAVGHFNNDNQPDIAIANYATGTIGILLGYGNRMFSNMTTYSIGNDTQPLSLALGDFNNDSHIDIVVANSNSNDIAVFTGYGDGSFSMFTTYSMGEYSQPLSIAAGYFNRDFYLDIIVANFNTNNVGVLFGCGNGTFTNQTFYSLGYNSHPSWIVSKDLNNDGWEDIAVVTSGIDNIKIRLNLC